MKIETIELHIDNENFVSNLGQLKNEFKRDSFGFLQEQFIDYNLINIKNDAIVVERQTNMLTPFRGSGKITARISESEQCKTILNYDLKPIIDFRIQLTVLVILFLFWSIGVYFFGTWQLFVAGIIGGVIMASVIKLSLNMTLSSQKSYFQKSMNEIANKNGTQY